MGDVIPAGQEDHPALADPELREVIDHAGPAALPGITVLAAELVARHTGITAEPVVAETLRVLRGDEPQRPQLLGDLTAAGEDYDRRKAAAFEEADQATAELMHYRQQALRALAGALDPDPGKAAWTVCWLAGNAVGGDFGDQLRLVVLSRLTDQIRSGQV